MTSIAAATQVLADAGVPSARHDAEALAAHVLGVARHALPRGDLGPAYAALVARRAAREPLQYIVGAAPFRRLELSVAPGVFIPRPETELLAGWVIDAVGAGPATVVDVCAGPGTIALAVAQECPAAEVHAVDVDPVAVAWARKNAAHHRLPVSCHEGDVRTALTHLDGSVDVVVSNPPYIDVADAARLDPEVREHEPHRALFAAEEGFDVIAAVVAAGVRLLRPGGLLAVEHGDAQGAAVASRLRAAGFTHVVDHRDLAGRDRFATARASGGLR